MNEVIITQQQVMTSLQISEATEKRHTDVMRDIRNMAEQFSQRRSASADSEEIKKDYHRGDRTQYKYLSDKTHEVFLNQCEAMVSDSGYVIEKSSYTDAQGKSRPMYVLNGKAVLLLASGYSVELRARIIDKLEELQCKEKKLDVDASYMAGLKEELRMEGIKRILRQYERESEIHASLAWMQGMRDMMHLGRASVAQMARQEGRRLGLPVPTTLPTGGGGGLLSVTALMRKRGLSGFTASEFNQRMIEAGGMVVRNGRKVLTGWGLDYGENRHSERTPEIVWPVYYEECFSYLCERIGVEFGLPF